MDNYTHIATNEEKPGVPQYAPGQRLRFTYPAGYSNDGERGYTAHSGCTVTIIRPMGWHEEYENLGDPMYKCRADDGWEGAIWESELEPA